MDMGLRGVRIWLAMGVLLAGLAHVSGAAACTCGLSLVGQYGDARILMLVRIGQDDGSQRDEEDMTRLWTFETLEVYIGRPALTRLQSEHSMCGAPLVPDVTFLIATDDSGHTHLCHTLRVDGNPYASAVISVLRAYKAGLISGLTEPWASFEHRDVCLLTHQFTIGGGELEFFYRFRNPESVETTQYAYAMTPRSFITPIEGQGAHPSTAPGFMNLRVRFPAEESYLTEHSGRVIVGAKEWRTARTLMEDHVHPYEVVDEAGAREILAALADASSISLEWSMSNLPDFYRSNYPDYPDGWARTDLLYFGSALNDFEACVERGILAD